jgi:N-acetyl-gamma-glutamyl-phosphate reductase
LAIAPLFSDGLVKKKGIVVDSKSGVTGAGAKPKTVTHYPSVNEDFRPYSLTDHRHTPEIELGLSALSRIELNVLFTPHLSPLSRGILTTAYLDAVAGTTQQDIDDALETLYKDEPFIRIKGAPPSVRDVRGSNFCDVHIRLDPRTRKVIAITAIDNLVKGASGQAVQNMNLMLGFKETTGLMTPPLSP